MERKVKVLLKSAPQLERSKHLKNIGSYIKSSAERSRFLAFAQSFQFSLEKFSSISVYEDIKKFAKGDIPIDFKELGETNEVYKDVLLWEAVKAQSFSTVKKMLATVSDPTKVLDPLGNSLLQTAVKHGTPKIVQLLFALSFDLEHKNFAGESVFDSVFRSTAASIIALFIEKETRFKKYLREKNSLDGVSGANSMCVILLELLSDFLDLESVAPLVPVTELRNNKLNIELASFFFWQLKAKSLRNAILKRTNCFPYRHLESDEVIVVLYEVILFLLGKQPQGNFGIVHESFIHSLNSFVHDRIQNEIEGIATNEDLSESSQEKECFKKAQGLDRLIEGSDPLQNVRGKVLAYFKAVYGDCLDKLKVEVSEQTVNMHIWLVLVNLLWCPLLGRDFWTRRALFAFPNQITRYLYLRDTNTSVVYLKSCLPAKEVLNPGVIECMLKTTLLLTKAFNAYELTVLKRSAKHVAQYVDLTLNCTLPAVSLASFLPDLPLEVKRDLLKKFRNTQPVAVTEEGGSALGAMRPVFGESVDTAGRKTVADELRLNEAVHLSWLTKKTLMAEDVCDEVLSVGKESLKNFWISISEEDRRTLTTLSLADFNALAANSVDWEVLRVGLQSYRQKRFEDDLLDLRTTALEMAKEVMESRHKSEVFEVMLESTTIGSLYERLSQTATTKSALSDFEWEKKCRRIMEGNVLKEFMLNIGKLYKLRYEEAVAQRAELEKEAQDEPKPLVRSKTHKKRRNKVKSLGDAHKHTKPGKSAEKTDASTCKELAEAKAFFKTLDMDILNKQLGSGRKLWTKKFSHDNPFGFDSKKPAGKVVLPSTDTFSDLFAKSVVFTELCGNLSVLAKGDVLLLQLLDRHCLVGPYFVEEVVTENEKNKLVCRKGLKMFAKILVCDIGRTNRETKNGVFAEITESEYNLIKLAFEKGIDYSEKRKSVSSKSVDNKWDLKQLEELVRDIEAEDSNDDEKKLSYAEEFALVEETKKEILRNLSIDEENCSKTQLEMVFPVLRDIKPDDLFSHKN